MPAGWSRTFGSGVFQRGHCSPPFSRRRTKPTVIIRTLPKMAKKAAVINNFDDCSTVTAGCHVRRMPTTQGGSHDGAASRDERLHIHTRAQTISHGVAGWLNWPHFHGGLIGPQGNGDGAGSGGFVLEGG